MRVVTFYTALYADLVPEWLDDARNIGGLDPTAVAMPDRGSWRANVGMKPKFLLNQLHSRGEPILFVDVDGRFRAPWDLDLSGNDFAAYFIDESRMPVKDKPCGRYDGISSGTLYLAPSAPTITLLQRWQEAEHGQYRYGQIVLGEVWHTQRPVELRTYRLPQRYFKVFDRPWYAGEGGGPVVIEHMQASRQRRGKVARP